MSECLVVGSHALVLASSADPRFLSLSHGAVHKFCPASHPALSLFFASFCKKEGGLDREAIPDDLDLLGRSREYLPALEEVRVTAGIPQRLRRAGDAGIFARSQAATELRSALVRLHIAAVLGGGRPGTPVVALARRAVDIASPLQRRAIPRIAARKTTRAPQKVLHAWQTRNGTKGPRESVATLHVHVETNLSERLIRTPDSEYSNKAPRL